MTAATDHLAVRRLIGTAQPIGMQVIEVGLLALALESLRAAAAWMQPVVPRALASPA